MRDEDVHEVQRLYPQIFVACHTEHVRATSTKWRISSQDASILVHLDINVGIRPKALAKHLGVAPSTLSGTISRLSNLGYITSQPVATDRRQRELRLTARGKEAVAATSVLDRERVKGMLKKLSASERKTALAGLALLARAARETRV